MQDMDAVYRQHFRMVYQYLMSLTHQPDVAEELAQETFCQAVSSIHRYDGSCKITTWLCAIAKNQYLSYLRKHPLHEDLTDTEAELPHTPSAEQEALSSAGKMELLQCLHQFQEPYREVIYLRVFGNLHYPLDQILTGLIRRVSFPREYKLNRTIRVIHDLIQTIQITEQQMSSFIGSKRRAKPIVNMSSRKVS